MYDELKDPTLKKEREILKLKKNQKEKEKEDKNSVFQNL